MTYASVNLNIFVGISFGEISDSSKTVITLASEVILKQKSRVSWVSTYIESVAISINSLRVIFPYPIYQLLPFRYLKCHLYSRKNS
jgi:hypothetical protein